MAPKPVDIDVATDTRQFQKGIDKGVIKPLEDVSEALDDVSKDGDKAGDKLTDSMKDAQHATEQLQKAIKDGSAQKKFAANTKESTSQAKQDLEELGSEAKQNAAETFSSFDGSMSSFADGIQGTFGGIVSSLGPIGAAAGAAAAIGIGLFTAASEKAKERAQKVKEKVGELADTLIETGGVGVVSIESISDALRTMATETDDAEQSLADIADQATKSQLPFKLLAKAQAGDQDALKEAIRLTKEQITHDQHLASTQQELNDSWGNSANAYNVRLAASQDVLASLEDEQSAIGDAQTAEKRWLSSGGAEYATKQALIEGINSAYDDSAAAVDDFIDAESGLFDVSKYIDAMEKRSKALSDYQDNLVKSGLSPDVVDFLADQGAETASIMVKGYIDASPAQQAKLLAIWKTAASDVSGVVDTKMTDVMAKTYAGPKITPTLDTRAFENGLRQLGQKQRTVNVDAVFTTRNGAHIR